MKKNLKGREARKTFWHEAAHHILDKKMKLAKKIDRRHKEQLVEDVARLQVGQKPKHSPKTARLFIKKAKKKKYL